MKRVIALTLVLLLALPLTACQTAQGNQDASQENEKNEGKESDTTDTGMENAEDAASRADDNPIYAKLLSCLASIREKTDFEPEIGLTLGSGLGDYVDQVDVVETIPYSEIEGFPQSTVEGHKGCFVFGYVEGVPVVIMQGRVHYYEGYEITDVVLPTRLMGLLGARKIILTNAAGAINTDMQPGDLMMITDHISSMIPSPLIGKNIDELGPRFPDMSEVYSKRLQELIRGAASECGLTLQEGVYVQLPGPNYETPAEIRMCRSWGADAVGMSTACEAMAARHMGLEVCGISCITNMAAGIENQALDHEEVQATADQVAASFQSLVTKIIVDMGELPDDAE